MPHVVVPEGHLLEVTVATPLPKLVVRRGGWVAELGSSSDAVEEELDAIIAEVDALVAKPREGRVVMARGGVEMQEMFAPGNPEVMALPCVLLWVIDPNALVTPALVGKLVDQLRKHQIPQTVFVRESESPHARAVIAAIQSLDIGVRQLEMPDLPVLVEVTRPDDTLISMIFGRPLDRMPLAGLPGGMSPSVARAPKLRSLLLAARSASRKELYAALGAREIPLVAIGDPDKGVRRRTWDDGFTALPVHADRSSLLQTARELGLAPESFKIMEMVPRELFAFAAKNGWAVAINVFDDDGKSQYVAIQPTDVVVLSEDRRLE
jgi:hypothetical protein